MQFGLALVSLLDEFLLLTLELAVPLPLFLEFTLLLFELFPPLTTTAA